MKGSLRTISLQWKRELRETLRDRRTLAVLVLFPLVVYPLLALVSSQALSHRMSSLAARPSRVAIGALSPEAARDAKGALSADPKAFALVPAPSDPTAAVVRGEVDAVIVSRPDAAPSGGERLALVWNSAREESRQARDRSEDALVRLLPPGCFARFRLIDEDAAPAVERSGYVLSKVLPLVLVVMVMLGAFYPAIDTTAGERERGTLETTLVAPVKRFDLLLGKVLAVATLATLTGLGNLVSMGLTFVQIARLAQDSAPAALTLPWTRVLAAAAVTVPAALFLSSLMIAVATSARSFKEAQNLLTPIYVAVFAPTVVATMGEYALTVPLAFIPGVNLTLLVRELVLGRVPWAALLVTLASTLFYAACALRVASWLFNSERLLSVDDARRPATAQVPRPPRPLNAGDALSLFAYAFIVFLLLAPLARHSVVVSVLVSQWIGMLGLVLAFARLKRLPLAQTLGWTRPRPLALLGAVLMGASAWVFVATISEHVLRPPPELMDQLRKTLVGSDRGVMVNLFLVGLTPAICEEALFRGPILTGLRSRLPRGAAIVVVALLFAVFHLSLYRLLPTALLGLMLGWIAVESGSVLASTAAHLVNNALLVTLATYGKDDAIERASPLQQAILLTVALLVTGAGALLVRRGRVT